MEVPLHIARLSNLVTNAIEDDDDDDSSSSDSDDDDASNSPRMMIMIPNVDHDILQKVIEFCTYHETEEQMTPISTPLQSCKLEDLVQDWYVQFCHDATPKTSTVHSSTNTDKNDLQEEEENGSSSSSSSSSSTRASSTTTNQLFELVAAANYMDIKPLLDLTCLAVSIWIKGKSAEEITQMFYLNLNIDDNGGDGVSGSSVVVGEGGSKGDNTKALEEEDETKWCDKPTATTATTATSA